MKVKLIQDLTKYNTALIVGTIGDVLGVYGERSQKHPQTWVGVDFDGVMIDVLRKHLEVLREESPPTEGPHIEVISDTPPKYGDVIDFAGIQFKMIGLIRRVSQDVYLVCVTPL